MKRDDFLKMAPLSALALAAGNLLPARAAAKKGAERKKGLVLTVAHLTDIHIRPEDNVPDRYLKCIDLVKRHKIDFILNGGDSIHAADYGHIKMDRVLSQWETWDRCTKPWGNTKIYSCIGNHDPWWAAPSKDHDMYGKDYVVKRLGIPNRYYSFNQSGWYFIILDGNNKNISLDPPQLEWLEATLHNIPAGAPVILMSHFPMFGPTISIMGGGHSDNEIMKDLFYKHRDKVKLVLSGHNHIVDKAMYNDVWYCCNGAMSGFWWENGNEKSKGKGYVHETPPGYAILNLYKDGSFDNEYFPHTA